MSTTASIAARHGTKRTRIRQRSGIMLIVLCLMLSSLLILHLWLHWQLTIAFRGNNKNTVLSTTTTTTLDDQSINTSTHRLPTYSNPIDTIDTNLDDDRTILQNYRRFVQDRFDANRTQVTTLGGAFVHIGKTGGSSLSVLLRNGCHSWLQHPCRVVPNETLASRLIQSYYHVADFGTLRESQHDFYVLSTRDPYDRTLSAFVYQHALNLLAQNQVLPIKDARSRKEFQLACTVCFPTLERFVLYLSDTDSNGTFEHDVSRQFLYPYRRNRMVVYTSDDHESNNCQNLSRAVFHGHVRLFHHLYFHYRRIREYIPNIEEQTLLVTRLEHLWPDWKSVNENLAKTFPQQLEGNTKMEQEVNTAANHDSSGDVTNSRVDSPLQQSTPQTHLRSSSSFKDLPVTRQLSPHAQQVLCRALQPEYDAYFWILSRAQNIPKGEMARALQTARKRCPKVSINFKALTRT